VVHHCANCDYLDYSLHQGLRNLAYQHSMETCLRPGGGAFGSDHRTAMTRQGVLDNMLLASHAKNGSNARVQRGQKLLAIDHGDIAGGRSDGGVTLRRATLRMQAMSTVSAGPEDGATPSDGQHVQDDTGADMHMLDNPAWCPLGATDKSATSTPAQQICRQRQRRWS
jgi:hypothetical protein